MSVRRPLWCLLAALSVSGCWAAIPSKRQTLPSIDNSLPSPDKDAEEGELVMQMPSCRAVKGVCARRQDCQDEYIYEAFDLCGEDADTVCCLTRFTFEKHVLQLQSCADIGSVCTFEEDCPEQDRHSNPLLCGEQPGVTCCKTLPSGAADPFPRKAHNVQLPSCEAKGGICRQEEQCPEADRLGNSDMCGDQPDITCCQASDLDKPKLPFNEAPEKKSIDRKMFELKYKRQAHTVQQQSCRAQPGMCTSVANCREEDQLGADMCGGLDGITCCRLPFLETEQSTDVKEKRRVGQCSARGGECVPKSVCQNGPKDKHAKCFGDDVCCIWTRMENTPVA